MTGRGSLRGRALAAARWLVRSSSGRVVLAWLAARLLVATAYPVLGVPGRGYARGDLNLYAEWAEEIASTGAMPEAVTWMYPPGAAVLLLLVDALPGAFAPAWTIGILALDAAVLALLLRLGRHRAGALAWAVLVPLLGLLAWSRLDLVPVAATAASLLLAGRARATSGALAALGTAVKAWPVALGLLSLRDRRWLAAAAATGLAVAAVLTLAIDDAWDFVGHLAGRGIQVESVLATPWLLRQAAGAEQAGGFRNGTYELLGPGTDTLADAAPLAMAVAVGTAWWVSRGRSAALRWYAMVLALLATSSLLSTQFVLWLVGAAAVACAEPGRDGALARRTLPVVAAVVVLSHAAFPLQWDALVDDGQLAAATVTVRNVLLVALAVGLLVAISVTASARRARLPAAPPAARPTPATTTPTPPTAVPPRPTVASAPGPPADR